MPTQTCRPGSSFLAARARVNERIKMVASAECAPINSTRADKNVCLFGVYCASVLKVAWAHTEWVPPPVQVEHSHVIIISSFHFRYIELAECVRCCQRRHASTHPAEHVEWKRVNMHNANTSIHQKHKHTSLWIGSTSDWKKKKHICGVATHVNGIAYQ